MELLLIGLGGMLGSIVRYSLGRFINTKWTAEIPVGTMAINITGAVLLGLSSGFSMDHDLYLFAGVGFLGAYTTFSTFMYEGFSIIEDRELFNAAVYIAGSVILGIAGYALGFYLLKWL